MKNVYKSTKKKKGKKHSKYFITFFLLFFFFYFTPLLLLLYTTTFISCSFSQWCIYFSLHYSLHNSLPIANWHLFSNPKDTFLGIVEADMRMQWFSLHSNLALQFLFSMTRFVYFIYNIFIKFLLFNVCCTFDLCVHDTYTYPFRYVNTTLLVSFASRSSLLSQWMAMPRLYAGSMMPNPQLKHVRSLCSMSSNLLGQSCFGAHVYIGCIVSEVRVSNACEYGKLVFQLFLHTAILESSQLTAVRR